MHFLKDCFKENTFNILYVILPIFSILLFLIIFYISKKYNKNFKKIEYEIDDEELKTVINN